MTNGCLRLRTAPATHAGVNPDRLALVESRHAARCRLFERSPISNGRVALAQRATIVVVPLFLGTGGHLRNDVPALVSVAEQQAGVPVSVASAAGEDASVLEALAEYCLDASRS
jgi:sirohydrochlorin ferrochelatase